MLYSKKLTYVILRSRIGKSQFRHGKGQGCSPLTLGWKKILTVHRQGDPNLSLKTKGLGFFLSLICSNENKKLLRNFSSKMPKILRNF